MCVCCQLLLHICFSLILHLVFISQGFPEKSLTLTLNPTLTLENLPGSQGCFIWGDDVIFVRQAWARGAQPSFPPSFHTFTSTLNQRRDAGGRGLSSTRGSTQGTQPGQMRTDVHGTLPTSGMRRTFYSHFYVFGGNLFFFPG